MAFRWHADDGPTLNAGLVAVIFQGIRTFIARKPNIFVIFQGGPDPLSPPLDLHMIKGFPVLKGLKSFGPRKRHVLPIFHHQIGFGGD